MNINELLVNYEPMIHSIINQFYIPEGLERDDLLQAGRIGIWKAYKKYERKKNTQFSTYAYPSIRNEILSLLRKNSRYQKEMNPLYEYHSEDYEFEREILNRFIVEDLEKEEQTLIHYLYLGYTQREIAKKLDTTQPRICQRIRELRIKGQRKWGKVL